MAPTVCYPKDMGTLLWLLLPAMSLAAPRPQPVKSSPLYRIPLVDIDGKAMTLGAHQGKVLLIVNTASKCGYTPQYRGLQGLHEAYGPRGLVVVGVPSNDFRGQEPGSEAEIKRFCELKYKVSFPMLSKVKVLGPDKHPLYKWLTENAPEKGEVGWNFEKFLVDRSGRVVGRYPSKVTPDAPELLRAIEGLL